MKRIALAESVATFSGCIGRSKAVVAGVRCIRDRGLRCIEEGCKVGACKRCSRCDLDLAFGCACVNSGLEGEGNALEGDGVTVSWIDRERKTSSKGKAV